MTSCFRNGLSFVAVAAVIALVGSAAAAPADTTATAAASPAKPLFTQMDANGDNKVTPEEMKAFLKARYVLLNSDGDAKLTPKEFLAGVRKQWDTLDANHDGGWSESEMTLYYVGAPAKADRPTTAAGKAKGSIFQKMDANGSGTVEPGEFIGYYEKDWKRTQKERAGANITPKEHERRYRQIFRTMDTDQDKAVTLDEYAKYWTGEATIGK